MSLAVHAIIELEARLALACRALGVRVEDVRLDDLEPAVREQLVAEATRRFWQRIEATSPRK